MQQRLFDTTADGSHDEQPSQPEVRQPKKTSGRRAEDATEPEPTLFGIRERKPQARQRAQEISRLLNAINEAPAALECHRGHIESLAYFIERSDQIALDPNDRDGLLRTVGDLEELLTEADCQAMRNNPKIWHVYPQGWFGVAPGETYAAALHSKEIAYLREKQEELREEIDVIEQGVLDAHATLERLRSVGPLPEDLAQKYGLTPEGHRIKGGKISR